MKRLLILVLLVGVAARTNGQSKPVEPVWTEADRKYLLENLTRSKEEILKETKDLSKKQWDFKESPDRWSISQVIEHLARWELILTYDISRSLQQGPIPSFEHYLPDSIFLNRDPEVTKPNNTLDATKPFSLGVPLGLNEGKNNVTWLMTMRDESIAYLKAEMRNIRQFYICFGPNVHQQYMVIVKHTDRHLHQIRRVKAHANYPR